jgi:hypothetical protein
MATDDLLTSTQAGALIGKSGKTILRLMEAGRIAAVTQLPGTKGAYLFRRGDVERLAQARRASPA